ncbi:MAG: DUF2232 domain-containing protein [Thomasclavelia sp.]
MNNKQIKMMTQGAMLVALFGVLGIMNMYTGSLFDVLLAYVMVVILVYYTFIYDYQAGLMVLLAAFIVLFLVGQMFFTFYTTFTLTMGVFYGYCLKHQKSYRFGKYGLMVISAIKNFLVFFILGGLVGINLFTEGMEMYQALIGLLPFLKGILNPMVMLGVLWILLFICEGYIVRVYSNLLIVKMMKRK